MERRLEADGGVEVHTGASPSTIVGCSCPPRKVPAQAFAGDRAWEPLPLCVHLVCAVLWRGCCVFDTPQPPRIRIDHGPAVLPRSMTHAWRVCRGADAPRRGHDGRQA
jgi:hypothetical protein